MLDPQENESLEQIQARAAEGQSLFRKVNERIEERIEELRELGHPSPFVVFVCECLTVGCSETIGLTEQEYESLRGNSNQFAVKPGHVVPVVEVVVDSTDRYEIVAKLGAGVLVAERLNPRQRERRLYGIDNG